jgi:hypothetical protein
MSARDRSAQLGMLATFMLCNVQQASAQERAALALLRPLGDASSEVADALAEVLTRVAGGGQALDSVAGPAARDLLDAAQPDAPSCAPWPQCARDTAHRLAHTALLGTLRYERGVYAVEVARVHAVEGHDQQWASGELSSLHAVVGWLREVGSDCHQPAVVLEITLDKPEGEIFVGNVAQPPAPRVRLAVSPRRHAVVWRRSDGRELATTASCIGEGGCAVSFRTEASGDTDAPNAMRIAAWSTLGLAIGAAATATGLALRAEDLERSLEADCQGVFCATTRSDAQSRADEASRMTLASHVVFGISAASAVSSIVLFWYDAASPKEGGTSGLRLEPSPGGAALSYRF